MKIAMLTNNYKPFVGGIQISIERQAKELKKLGHEVVIFAPKYEGTEEWDLMAEERIIRYRTGKHKIKNGMPYPTIFMREIHSVFEKESFDCIHVHHPLFIGNCALHLGKKYKIPVIYTYHTRYEDYLHYLGWFQLKGKAVFLKKKLLSLTQNLLIPEYMRWFTNHCDLVLAPSLGMQKVIQKNGTKTPISVFPTGLAEEFFIPDERRSRELREQYLKGKRHLFCTISRLEEEKNPEFLLYGIAEVKKILGPDFCLMYIGEGSQREHLERLAEKLGIAEEIVFVGSVDNEQVKDYLNAADLFLYASKSETQGIVLAEAMAGKNPVVAVRATGVDDIVKDGVNGFRTKEDVDEWAKKVVRALQPNIYRQLRNQAEVTAGRYRSICLAVYEEMLYTQCIYEKQHSMEKKIKWSELGVSQKVTCQ
ncbi:MAG: glycosyltransferase family 4 protein, partial [Lachnospiraceae bacterium]|nr:glycosyltransferase family 4 protein [Lachnospiraceae bacterium]